MFAKRVLVDVLTAMVSVLLRLIVRLLADDANGAQPAPSESPLHARS